MTCLQKNRANAHPILPLRMSHVSWSQLENGASLFRNAPTSVSSEIEEDEYGDDSPRLASPDNKNLRIFSRPSTSSRALKSFAQCQEKSKEEEDSSVSIATPLNRLKSRTAQHKQQQQKQQKKKAFSMKKALKNTTREKEQNFQLRAIVTRSPEPSKRALAPSLKEPNEVHTKVSDGSTLFRRAKREEKKVKVKMNNNNNNNNCNIALIPEEKLEHLLRICREAAGGEHWREKMQALEQLSSRSHAYSISRSSSVLTRAIEDGGKHVQDLRACLAKAALKFLRALCEHFDNNQTCVSNSSNAFTLLATVLLKRASDGSAFLKQDALGSLRLLHERIGSNAFLKIILAQPSNVNPRVRRTMALCLSTVDDKETKIERQTSERVLLVKKTLEKDGDAETRAYARKILIFTP